MLIGKEINGYKILKKLGSGGMGEVFYARHDKLNREAAIKILYQENMAERFKNEAYIQASVKHPNIAVLYEFSQIDDKSCIIMEYVEGITLDKYVSTNSLLDSKEIAFIFKQVCQAISYLHAESIQHRDITQNNIKITKDRQVKLLDFGIAKSKFTPKLTREGYVVGTADFMAPEQFSGSSTIQSDIWALGILLYFLCTKHLPFNSKSMVELRQNIELGRYTKPQILNPNISGKYQRLIAQMLSVRVSKRPFIDEVLEKLDAPTDEHQVKPKSWIGNEIFIKNKVYIGIISFSLLFGLGLWAIKAGVSKAEEIPVIEMKPETVQLERIEIVVQNSNRVKIRTSDNRVIDSPPFFIERKPGEPVQFTITEDSYSKQITVGSDFKGDRFICNMDY